MAERPILFSAPMVQAILAGRKTQTRRLAKPRSRNSILAADESEPDGLMWADSMITDPGNRDWLLKDAAGQPGDQFWVRENFALVPATAYRMSEGVQQQINPHDAHQAAIYAAGWERSIPKWTPCIHMPRWASRLLLPPLRDVRVERLEVLSEADAIAEGVYPASVYGGRVESWLPTPEMRDRFYPTARQAYVALWEHLHGKDSWAANPRVWVYDWANG